MNIGGCEAHGKRNPISIRYNMMFASRATPIYRVGSGAFAPLFCLDDRAVNTHSDPVQLLGVVHILQNSVVNFLPNTGFLPIPQPAPAGHAASAPHLVQKIFTWNTRLEYKNNSGQGCPVRYPGTSSFG